MKKGILLLIIVFVAIFITGCEELPENTVLTGYKNLSNGETEELIYEWKYDDLETVVKLTRVYTYTQNTDRVYNLKAIECEAFEKQSSLYKCSVERKDGKVIYKEIVNKDSKATIENIEKNLKNNGYKIKE